MLKSKLFISQNSLPSNITAQQGFFLMHKARTQNNLSSTQKQLRIFTAAVQC